MCGQGDDDDDEDDGEGAAASVTVVRKYREYEAGLGRTGREGGVNKWVASRRCQIEKLRLHWI